MITGAQAKIPAIGLSGPNALISGRSFTPEVTEEALNKYTFNIIVRYELFWLFLLCTRLTSVSFFSQPNRDIVPRLDDVADQFQYIRCEAGAWDFVGCHGAARSVCEIMYTCGTGANRPAICECHTKFGYPKPQTDGDEDFDALCPTD